MPTVSCSPAGRLPDGRIAHRWRLTASNGVRADVLTLGASLDAVYCPDRDGRLANVVLSPLRLADKLTAARYFGATVGRYANRVAHGVLPTPDGPLRLSRNENGHTLHGGAEGFDVRIWHARPHSGGGRHAGVELRLVSPAGDQGFPGTLRVTVRYSLHDDGELRIDYFATADAGTPVNLTNHAYWNLSAGAEDTLHGHHLSVAADRYTPVDTGLIPLAGPPQAVGGTPFDLTEPRPLAEAFTARDEQLSVAGGGYDHNWALRDHGPGPRPAAVLSHPGTGRRLECLTTEPGLQVYTANHFAGTVLGRRGRALPRYAGVALETQHFPNAPHRPDYPTTWHDAGRPYRSTTLYRLGTVS